MYSAHLNKFLIFSIFSAGSHLGSIKKTLKPYLPDKKIKNGCPPPDPQPGSVLWRLPRRRSAPKAMKSTCSIAPLCFCTVEQSTCACLCTLPGIYLPVLPTPHVVFHAPPRPGDLFAPRLVARPHSSTDFRGISTPTSGGIHDARQPEAVPRRREHLLRPLPRPARLLLQQHRRPRRRRRSDRRPAHQELTRGPPATASEPTAHIAQEGR